MAQVVVELTGDEAQLLKAYQKMAREHADMAQQLKEVGKQAKKAGQEMQEGPRGAEGAIIKFADTTIAKFGIAGLAAGAFNKAIELGNNLIREKHALMKEALDSQTNLAGAQSVAIQNLSGLSTEEKSTILNDVIPSISRQASFGDLGALTSAFGAAFSASGDRAKSQDATLTAAKLSRYDPQAVDELAGGLLDLSRAAGVADMGQIAGFMLTAGANMRLSDRGKIAETLAPSVAATVATAPMQDSQQAAREGAALFASLTKAAVDVTGDSSRTAVTQLAGKLAEAFNPSSKDNLLSMMSETLGPNAPTTIRGRIEAFQNNQQLRDEFLSKPFGEERFKTAFKQLFDPASDVSKDFLAAAQAIDFSSAEFDKTVREIDTLTPSLRAAKAAQATSGAIQRIEVSDEAGGIRAQLKDSAKGILRKTRGEGLGFGMDFIAESLSQTVEDSFGLQASTPAGDAATRLAQLQSRRRSLMAGGLTVDEEPKVAGINDVAKEIRSRLGDLSGSEAKGQLAPGGIKEAIGVLAGVVRMQMERSKNESDPAVAGQYQRDIAENSEVVRLLMKLLEATKQQTGTVERAMRNGITQAAIQRGTQ